MTTTPNHGQLVRATRKPRVIEGYVQASDAGGIYISKRGSEVRVTLDEYDIELLDMPEPSMGAVLEGTDGTIWVRNNDGNWAAAGAEETWDWYALVRRRRVDPKNLRTLRYGARTLD